MRAQRWAARGVGIEGSTAQLDSTVPRHIYMVSFSAKRSCPSDHPSVPELEPVISPSCATHEVLECGSSVHRSAHALLPNTKCTHTPRGVRQLAS